MIALVSQFVALWRKKGFGFGFAEEIVHNCVDLPFSAQTLYGYIIYSSTSFAKLVINATIYKTNEALNRFSSFFRISTRDCQNAC